MLTEKELIDGQRWLKCWEKVTIKPMTSRETFFACEVEAAACAERDARIAELESENKGWQQCLRQYQLDEEAQDWVEQKDSFKLRIAELERELASANAQAAGRYQWLAWTSDTHPICIYDISNGQVLFGSRADTAIDNARKGVKHGRAVPQALKDA